MGTRLVLIKLLYYNRIDPASLRLRLSIRKETGTQPAKKTLKLTSPVRSCSPRGSRPGTRERNCHVKQTDWPGNHRISTGSQRS